MPKPRTSLRYAILAGTALAGTALAGQPVVADELPTGPSVVHGSVGITTPRAGNMAIQQSSQSAIVGWQGFSIGGASSVDIRQPSTSSVILNRVTGETPSTIAGRLTANGQVYLVNPNGIAITRSGSVQAGAFVASTLDIPDEDFLAGRREFSGDGHSAAVSNQGTVEIGRGGYAALLGGEVENAGTISVPLGRIGLGAGERVTLDLSGDGFLSVALPSEGAAADALIQSSGRLSADGGRIEISAATARRAARYAVNLSGVAEARSVSGRPGQIVLGGGPGGIVAVSGRLDAGAAPAGDGPLAISPLPSPRPWTGGAIDITGAEIRLAGAALDASGRDGGGTIRVGGDYQGGGALPRARTTSVDASTRISANALEAGDGGRVIVWSDEMTSFAGEIAARGGPSGGDGGFAEVSGKQQLVFAGEADLRAPGGAVGTLLLDPFDLVIANAPEQNVGGGGSFPVEFTSVGDPSVVDAALLQSQLAGSDVVVQTGQGGDPDGGDITVSAPLSWSSGNSLTLLADSDIIIDADITATSFDTGEGIDNPDLTLIAGDSIFLNGGLSIDGTISFSGDVRVETDEAVVSPGFLAPEFDLPDPGDEIAYGGAGGGPIAASPEGKADPVAAAEATLDGLVLLSGNLETAVEACRGSGPELESYLDCLGSSLDQYARQIDRIALDLPEPLRGVSATIQQASREIADARDTAVRQLATARSPAERTRIRREAAAKARAAVATATAEIRKQIALIRADEPEVARLQAEQGDAITGALDIVGRDLERVVGL